MREDIHSHGQAKVWAVSEKMRQVVRIGVLPTLYHPPPPPLVSIDGVDNNDGIITDTKRRDIGRSLETYIVKPVVHTYYSISSVVRMVRYDGAVKVNMIP